MAWLILLAVILLGSWIDAGKVDEPPRDLWADR